MTAPNTRDGHLGPIRDKGTVELLDALDDSLGHLHRVHPFLFGDRDGHRRGVPFQLNVVVVGSGAGPHPDIGIGLLRSALDGDHVAQKDRPSPVKAHHQITDLLGGGQEGAGLDQDLLIVRGQGQVVGDPIAGLQ